MLISLSILEYEPELSANMNSLEKSEGFSKMMRLVQTGRLHDIHIDVMRPPLIPNKSKFSISLIRKLYESLHEKIALTIHLMVPNPLEVTKKINEFIEEKDRKKITLIVQVESFDSEEDILKTIKTIREYGYRIGVGLNLPTPKERLTDKIVKSADIILLMTVPMGAGKQKFHEEALQRIRDFSHKFPDKIIKVDGGINPRTIVEVWRAGARATVIGSYLSLNKKPEQAILNLESALKAYAGS